MPVLEPKYKSTALFCGNCSQIRQIRTEPDRMKIMDASPPQGVRARARAQLLDDVSRIARSHLAAEGAAGLSVRAIAREMGLASSALYRYYPSRDALLTQLIIEAYDDLGQAAEKAEAKVDRSDLAGRARALARSVRGWAIANPHEFALIYGSPVPGYQAPEDTIDPATRVSALFVSLTADMKRKPKLRNSQISPSLEKQLKAVDEFFGVSTNHEALALGIGMWAQIFGMVSFEIFGTFNNAFDDAEAIFEFQVDAAIQALNL